MPRGITDRPVSHGATMAVNTARTYEPWPRVAMSFVVMIRLLLSPIAGPYRWLVCNLHPYKVEALSLSPLP